LGRKRKDYEKINIFAAYLIICEILFLFISLKKTIYGEARNFSL